MNIKLEDPKYYLLNCKKIKPDLSYELFLLEVLNSSWYFMAKSCNKKYHSPESESHGENDAITEHYQLDFKLLVSQEMMKLKSKSIPNINYSLLDKGIITIKEKDKIESKKVPNILFRLMNFNSEKNNSDIQSLLDNLKKPKNLFIFFPYEFNTNKLMSTNDMKRLLEVTLHNVLKYRSSNQPNKDTYICVFLNNQFVIFEWINNELHLIDKVKEYFCPTYKDLKLLSIY